MSGPMDTSIEGKDKIKEYLENIEKGSEKDATGAVKVKDVKFEKPEEAHVEWACALAARGSTCACALVSTSPREPTLPACAATGVRARLKQCARAPPTHRHALAAASALLVRTRVEGLLLAM